MVLLLHKPYELHAQDMVRGEVHRYAENNPPKVHGETKPKI